MRNTISAYYENYMEIICQNAGYAGAPDYRV